MIVSHDRYFVERVCDNVHALTAGGGIRHLPGGIDQYLAERPSVEDERPGAKRNVAPAAKQGMSPGAATKTARKEVQRAQQQVKRLEREIDKLTQHESTLHEQMTANATDHGRLAELQSELERVVAERERVEVRWLEMSESLEG